MSSGALGFFAVNRVIAGTECRIGSLRLLNSCIDTPSCLQYTRSGALPHIEWQQADKHVNDNEAPLLVSADNVVKLSESLARIGTCLSDFARVPRNRLIFLTVNDYLKGIPHGMNDNQGIAAMTVGGRIRIQPEDYHSMIKAIKPHFALSLCDSDAPPGSSKKRVSHTVKRSDKYLENLITFTGESIDQNMYTNGHQRDKAFKIFAPIEGGFIPEARSQSVKLCLEKGDAVSGFVIEGLTDSTAFTAADVDGTCEYLKSVSTILVDILKVLPQDKPRALFGPLKPEFIWHFACLGIDFFDSSYATKLAESSHALFIQFTRDDGGGMYRVTSSEIDLSDKNLFKEDFTIIDESCECYTCKTRFTKAYICHLIDTREMLASTLLLHHNLNALYSFFRDIRQINIT